MPSPFDGCPLVIMDSVESRNFFRSSGYNNLSNLEDEIITLINALTPMGDHYTNSSINFNTLSSKEVMRIKIIINQAELLGYTHVY